MTLPSEDVLSVDRTSHEDAILVARSIDVGYNDRAVVHKLDLEVRPGEVVALLGANGAGKTTTLLALAGVLPVLGGEIIWDGDSSSIPLHRRVKQGLRLITEDRAVLMTMTVRDNLRVAGQSPSDACEIFPELRPLLNRRVGLLSGGEQQMLSVGRALAERGRLLLADEISLGLAPMVVARLMSAIRSAADDGLAVVLVEQQIRHALGVADRVCVLRRGHKVFEGKSSDLRGRPSSEIESLYLGEGDTPDPEGQSTSAEPAPEASEDNSASGDVS
jgi:branched-chain amino acid transport system ATP-binding protein